MGNSVIYRPAYDAEVEYLESTGTQWIDTGIKPDSTYTFDCKVAVTQDYYNCVYWGARDTQNDTNISNVYLNSNTAYVEVTLAHNIRLVSLPDWVDNRNWNSNIIPTVYTMYELTNITSVPDMLPTNTSVSLFGLNINGQVNTSVGICRIGYWKCYSNGVLVRDFIPVRIGSVGYLYDKVSKQLFANKGTGNFILGNDVSNAVIPQQRCVLYFGSQRSVIYERIYEEYDWLVATIPVGVLMMSLPLDSYNFYYQRIWQVFGNVAYFQTEGHTYFTMQGNRQVAIYDISTGQSYTYTSFPKIDAGELMTVDSNSTRTLIHNVEVERYAGEATTYIKFQNAGNGVNTTEYSTSSITVDGSVRYIPCKLLQSIPAILDGNGIARQAGECGMWDKVNNKFYGNVANSGTFTVKGPKCYEEYKWLIIPYTEKRANLLPIYSNNFSFQYIIYSVGNIGGVLTTNYGYFYYPNSTKCGIWGYNERAVLHNNSDLIPLGTPFDVECDSNGITMNGELMPNYGSSPYFDRLTIYCYTRTGKYALSKITVDGSVRYVPCKLTHGIPASMDANGIARSSGTCGMWDKVNDKFYGNVANSGTFTVSND